jgi:hypothetical protein
MGAAMNNERRNPMKHEGYTPGPWTVGGSMISNGKETIALMLRRPAVYGGKRMETRDSDAQAPLTGVTADANARLIADAPALLARVSQLEEALKRIDALAERSIHDCDPPVNFIGEIQDAARLALSSSQDGDK